MIGKKYTKYRLGLSFFAVLLFLYIYSPLVILAEDVSNFSIDENVIENSRVDVSGASLSVKVAPGEILPISIKLSNFGGGRKIDVIVAYEIFNDAQVKIYSATETVAVETTAQFVKNIQIPFDTKSGKYTAKALIEYQGQVVPASTQFTFIVEHKVLGLFQNDFYWYGFIMLLVIIATSVGSYFWVKRSRAHRLRPHEYPHVSSEDRVFYEIISDTIMQMRYRMGDKAIDIAKSIDELTINDSGKVLKIKADPAKIVALLILKYEKLLGQKVSFAVKKPNDKKAHHLKEVDKNLVIIKKYFE